MSTIASSPMSNAVSPASAYACAPSSPAPMTASDQPLRRACSRHASMAAAQCSRVADGVAAGQAHRADNSVGHPGLGGRGVAGVPDDRLVAPGGEVAERVVVAELAQQRADLGLLGRSSSVRVSAGGSEQDGGGDDHEDRAGQVDDASDPKRCGGRAAVAEPPEVDEHRVEHVHRRRADARRTLRTGRPERRRRRARPRRRRGSVASAQRRLPATRRAPNCGRADARDHDGAGNQHEPDTDSARRSRRRRCRRSGRSAGAPATRREGSTRRRAAGAAGRKPITASRAA